MYSFYAARQIRYFHHHPDADTESDAAAAAADALTPAQKHDLTLMSGDTMA